jgi:hypothetical protein
VLKKFAFVVVAGSLAFAAQTASADDTQFNIGNGRYLGVAALPFHATGAATGSQAMAPTATEQRLESTHAGARVTQDAPAPYDVPGGYFN